MKLKIAAMMFATLATVIMVPVTAHASPPPPVIEITPDTGLVNGQTINVDPDRLFASAHATLIECLAPKPGKRLTAGMCGAKTMQKDTTDTSGNLVNPNYTLTETFRDRNGKIVHCATPSTTTGLTTCVLLVTEHNKIDGRISADALLPFVS